MDGVDEEVAGVGAIPILTVGSILGCPAGGGLKVQAQIERANPIPRMVDASFCPRR